MKDDRPIVPARWSLPAAVLILMALWGLTLAGLWGLWVLLCWIF